MIDKIEAAAPDGLIVMGTCRDTDGTSIVLLGAGPGFWPEFTAAPEYTDGQAHPVDRWSKRVIGKLAETFGAACRFPSDGPPYAPFIRWALDTGRFFQSPVGMMVHDRVGMMVSLRGALLFDQALPEQPGSVSPCLACAGQPCATACPVGALSPHAPYDVPACHSFLDTSAGKSCMMQGCAARLACPLSEGAERDTAQSALHMRSFHPAGDPG